MTDQIDRAAIKARVEAASKESRYSPDSYVHLPPAEVLALLAALEEAERRIEHMEADCTDHRVRMTERAESAERRIAAVEAILTPEWSHGRAFPAVVGVIEVARLRAIAAALHPVAETTEKGGE